MGQLARDGEGHEAENANEKYEHVGVVEVVAGTARDRRRDGETRPFVFVPRVVDVFLGDFHVRVQVPLLLLLKIVCVYCALVVATRHEQDFVFVSRRRYRDAQRLNICCLKQISI